MLMDQIKIRLKTLFQKNRVERDLDEELQYHIQKQVEQNLSLGMTQKEAFLDARRGFGGIDQAKEQCRQATGTHLIEEAWQDLRYAVRMLIKKPSFTLTAAITLALGIGANTAIFSAVNSVLLKSMPFYQADSLVLVWGNKPSGGQGKGQVSYTDVFDWQNQNNVFEEVTTYASWEPILSGMGEPAPIYGMRVGDGYFSLMKSKPTLGRVFLPEEQVKGKDSVVVLSHGFWMRQFGGNPTAIGKTVTLNLKSYTIIGVMPADFSSLPATLIGGVAEIYRPVAEQHDDSLRGNRHLRAIARLKPGVSLAQAQANMDVIARIL